MRNQLRSLCALFFLLLTFNSCVETDNFLGLERIDNVTGSSVVLHWTHIPEAVSYQVFEVSEEEVYLATVEGPAESYQVMGLESEKTFSFRVRAVDSKGKPDSNKNDLEVTTKLIPLSPTQLSLLSPLLERSLHTTPTLGVEGAKSGDTIKVFKDSNCSEEVGSSLATTGISEIRLNPLSPGSYELYATITTSEGVSSNCSTASLSYEVINCPEGFIPVPPREELGVSEFCVMNYEAKRQGNTPISTPEDTPWVSISLRDAKEECLELGPGFDLLSNPEWLAISYDIESTVANWPSGTLGVGCLKQGNTGIVDLCAYDGNNPDFGIERDRRAKHVLSNGKEIWDLSGNVSEWIDWTLGGGLATAAVSCEKKWVELSEANCDGLSPIDYLPLNPANIPLSEYNANFRVGRIYGGTGGAVTRGFAWGNSSSAGVYSLSLNQTEFYSGPSIGFRCVFRTE